MTDPVLLDVCDLKTYFDTPRGVVKAVDGVSFTLEAGRTLGIVGESGSGKTVLSRSIMNLLPGTGVVPAGGTATFLGRDMRSLSEAELLDVWGREMAIVFQDAMTALNPVVRIGRQITEPIRRHHGTSKQEARAMAIALMRSVGIPEPEKRLREHPHRLSGGMRQRVTIAIALSCGPRLLIADEPTTALDVTVQKQILNLLRDQQRDRNMGMIVITHDLGVVANYADEILVMYAGQVVERAPTATLFRAMRHPYTQALLSSIPRIDSPSHTLLHAIPGRPPDLAALGDSCRFAPRCRFAQPRCLEEAPGLVAAGGSGPPDGSGPLGRADHEYRCFFPVGTPEGDEALARNTAAGITAAGTPVSVASGTGVDDLEDAVTATDERAAELEAAD